MTEQLRRNTAAPIKVFVVVIDSGLGDDVHTKIGACYWSEQAALEECERLEAAHWCTDAYPVERQLPWPTAFIRVTRAEAEAFLASGGTEWCIPHTRT